MENNILLPNKFKKLGWYIAVPAIITGLIFSFNEYEISWLNIKVLAILNTDFNETYFFQFIDDNITNELIGILCLIAGLFIAFSKEKKEDEFIANLRLNSLLWAVLVNYTLLFFAFMFVYGFAFFNVMIYNMFTVLIIFIIRFNYMLYKNSKAVGDEK